MARPKKQPREVAEPVAEEKYWLFSALDSLAVEDLRQHELDLSLRIYNAEVSKDYHTTALQLVREKLAEAGVEPIYWKPKESSGPH